MNRQTGKYLKYAAGEILLVVFGILIALSLNNWNSNRIEKNLEQTYLEGLKRDLENQLKEVDNHEERELSYVAGSKRLIEDYNQSRQFNVDKAFAVNIGKLVNRKTFVMSDPTYTELLSSGKIDLISNNQLKDAVVQYYQFLKRVEAIIKSNNANFIDDKFRSGIYDLSRFSMIETIKAALFPDNLTEDNALVNGLIDVDNPELLTITQNLLNEPQNELRFANLLQFRNTQATIHAFYMQQIRKRTTDLIVSLNAELPSGT